MPEVPGQPQWGNGTPGGWTRRVLPRLMSTTLTNGDEPTSRGPLSQFFPGGCCLELGLLFRGTDCNPTWRSVKRGEWKKVTGKKEGPWAHSAFPDRHGSA